MNLEICGAIPSDTSADRRCHVAIYEGPRQSAIRFAAVIPLPWLPVAVTS